MIPKNCARCGYCCQLIVPLNEKEIKRIKKLGYDEDYFTEKDSHGKKALKLINNYCIFLEINGGIARCRIYSHRPKRCRDYPGKNLCNLKKHFVFEENI